MSRIKMDYATKVIIFCSCIILFIAFCTIQLFILLDESPYIVDFSKKEYKLKSEDEEKLLKILDLPVDYDIKITKILYYSHWQDGDNARIIFKSKNGNIDGSKFKIIEDNNNEYEYIYDCGCYFRICNDCKDVVHMVNHYYKWWIDNEKQI